MPKNEAVALVSYSTAWKPADLAVREASRQHIGLLFLSAYEESGNAQWGLEFFLGGSSFGGQHFDKASKFNQATSRLRRNLPPTPKS